MNHVTRTGMLALMLAFTLALGGCATTKNPKDPLESFNRSVFRFNDAVDDVALKPAAQIYKNIFPALVQTGIGNFFGNIGDVWTAVNNMLQGKFANGLSDVMRVAVNSTFGLGGVLDIGSEAGLTKHKEDFGQTLGTWGVRSGPYVVLPLLGSSTIRDSLALPVDFQGDLWSYKDPTRWRNVGSVARVVDLRASVLDASDLIEAAALDRYEFVRDAYLQRREGQIRARQSDSWSNDDQPADDPAKSTPPAATPPVTTSSDKSSRNEPAPVDEHQATMELDMQPVVETANLVSREMTLVN